MQYLFLCLLLPAAQLDPTAKAYVLDAFKRMSKVEVAFTQETYSDFFDETSAGGMLRIERPGKMRMSYSRGERKVFIMDGRTYYEKDDLADTETRAPQADLINEPLIQLLLYGADLDRYFLMDRYKRDAQDIFRLRPRNDEPYTIEMRFGPNQMPSLVEVIGEDGEGTRLILSKYNFDPQFSAQTFLIPKPNSQD